MVVVVVVGDGCQREYRIRFHIKRAHYVSSTTNKKGLPSRAISEHSQGEEGKNRFHKMIVNQINTELFNNILEARR